MKKLPLTFAVHVTPEYSAISEACVVCGEDTAVYMKAGDMKRTPLCSFVCLWERLRALGQVHGSQARSGAVRP